MGPLDNDLLNVENGRSIFYRAFSAKRKVKMSNELNMTEAEKKALTKVNKIYEGVFHKMLEQWSATEKAVTGREPLIDLGLRTFHIPGLRDKNGRQVQIPAKPGRYSYLVYQVPKGKKHCYTPWKDTKGRYWAFTYIPRGKGSRSGKPERWAIGNEVSFTTRKAAKARALKRYYKGIEK